MFRFLFYIFLIYLAYRFIFNFLVPVYKTTQEVKKGFREMHDRMNQQQSSTSPSAPSSAKTTAQKPAGEYIEFEEIK